MTKLLNDQPITAPAKWLAWTEMARAMGELALLPSHSKMLAGAPTGDGHAVMVLPGFGGSDVSTAIMRRFLTRLGYDAREWGLGRNMGSAAIGDDGKKLVAAVERLADETSQRVSLVGWSLGGIMARMVAQRIPTVVRQVITLGSPYSGSPRANNVWRAYQWLTGDKIDDAQTLEHMSESALPLPMPATSIFSKTDGIVAWQNCIEAESKMAGAIEVRGSHCGLGANAAVLYAVADRLSQPVDNWNCFESPVAIADHFPVPAAMVN